MSSELYRFVRLRRHDKYILMELFLFSKLVFFQTPYRAVAWECWIFKKLLFRICFIDWRIPIFKRGNAIPYTLSAFGDKDILLYKQIKIFLILLCRYNTNCNRWSEFTHVQVRSIDGWNSDIQDVVPSLVEVRYVTEIADNRIVLLYLNKTCY